MTDPKICPFMSGNIAPVPKGNGGVQTVTPGGQVQVELKPVLVPCERANCQLFDEVNECCSFYYNSHHDNTVAGLVDAVNSITALLEPPKGSPSPIMRLANAVERLVELSEYKREH